MSFVAIGVLLHSPALRVYHAGGLPGLDVLRDAAYAFVPDALLAAPRGSFLGFVVLALYVAFATAALASWTWAVRLGRTVQLRSSLPLLFLTALLATPVLAYVGLFSDDVYLYNLYGRTIDVYGANPIALAPAAFPQDPHLEWVYWKQLPSSYGPIWLMLSALLSGLSGDSITAVVLTYRVGALLLHLATAAAVWFVLRRTRPGDAVAGTIFYAWNPLVLLEIVANAHNDVLVGLFAVLLVGAAAHKVWSSAAFFAACAVMVKPFSVVLLPALAVRMLLSRPDAASGSAGRRTPALAFASASATGAITILLLSLPLWAGWSLAGNISGNPASHIYTNTIWELISEAGPAWFGLRTVAIQHPYLDATRMALFIVGVCWILSRRWMRRGLAEVAVPLWVLFYLTASWVWPWYFVPAIALAALTRGGSLAVATALTAGGLFFWTTWPAPAVVPAIYSWRSLVLFGPLLMTLASSHVRAMIIDTLGGRRGREHEPMPLVPARLPAAPGGSSTPSSATAS